MRYRHYKGGIYEWICEAKLESDPTVTLVIYRSPEGTTWARPREVFFEQVMHEGKWISRFERID